QPQATARIAHSIEFAAINRPTPTASLVMSKLPWIRFRRFHDAPVAGVVTGGKAVTSDLSDELRSSALVYHRAPRPGKVEVHATKPLGNQRDLALAYTPGVAAACEAIANDPSQAAELTARANLVAVLSNGTAVLGLGNIGPLAGKPVMEGK